MDHARDAHQERYQSHSLPSSLFLDTWSKPGCVQWGKECGPSGALARREQMPSHDPGVGRGASSRAWHYVARSAWGDLVPGLPSMVRHRWALGIWWPHRWLLLGILVAPVTFAASLCCHYIPGWEQSPAGLRGLLAMGWAVLGPPGGGPGTTPSRLSRLLLPSPTGASCPGRGKGTLEPTQPQGWHLQPRGGAEQVCPALPALSVL